MAFSFLAKRTNKPYLIAKGRKGGELQEREKSRKVRKVGRKEERKEGEERKNVEIRGRMNEGSVVGWEGWRWRPRKEGISEGGKKERGRKRKEGTGGEGGIRTKQTAVVFKSNLNDT